MSIKLKSKKVKYFKGKVDSPSIFPTYNWLFDPLKEKRDRFLKLELRALGLGEFDEVGDEGDDEVVGDWKFCSDCGEYLPVVRQISGDLKCSSCDR